jgi:hypothetical protein
MGARWLQLFTGGGGGRTTILLTPTIIIIDSSTHTTFVCVHGVDYCVSDKWVHILTASICYPTFHIYDFHIPSSSGTGHFTGHASAPGRGDCLF